MSGNPSSSQSRDENHRSRERHYYPYNNQYDNQYYDYSYDRNNYNNYYQNSNSGAGQSWPQSGSHYRPSGEQGMDSSQHNQSYRSQPQRSADPTQSRSYNKKFNHNYRDKSYRNMNRDNNRNNYNNKSDDNSSNEVNNELGNGMTATNSTSHSNSGNNTDRKAIDREEQKRLNKNNNYRDFDRDNRQRHGFRNDKRNDERREAKPTNNKPKQLRNFENEESQREIMDDMLRKGKYECMVCCEEIRIRDSIWNCEHCYNVFHLKCIKTWANSETSTSSRSEPNQLSWRCPACQTANTKIPHRYQCFCGKRREPEFNHYLVPHSCGDMCGRKRKVDKEKKYECPHKCNLLCHPGPCPPCQTKVTRQCGCGQTKVTVNCAADEEAIICKNICNKLLNCNQHRCESVCHSGKCNDCQITKTQSCFCGKNNRDIKCDLENGLIDMYSCKENCGKTLNCGHHKCQDNCHSGQCYHCSLDPNLVTHCPCGRTQLQELTQMRRKLCTDPIPTCNQICGKELVCGSDKDRHNCNNVCHSGPCPPCDRKTVIKCRCGANSQNIECTQLENGEINSFICQKLCKKKRQCGRHKCLNKCCTDLEHSCDQICGKKLSCGAHTCPEMCHFSNCPQCWNVSWDELTCRCGTASLFPPIACSTKRPECGTICKRRHACDHSIDHNCHDDQECPPCTYFVSKACYGEHELRMVPCYETEVSCGFHCLKPLKCGLHECKKVCHAGNCPECTQPCNRVRDDCGHICGLDCHQNTCVECPKSICKKMIDVKCDCGRKSDQMFCYKVNDEKSLRLSVNALANARIKCGESINVSDIMRTVKESKLCQLKCDDKCAVMERNRQLAEALDIKDADFSPDPGPPNYSEMLKNAARSEPNFVKDVFEKLTKLVIESKQSKLPFKILNFPPMNSDSRHIIHELAEFFGCKTHAIDREPNRSVVVKVVKDKCYLPTVNIMDAVKDETDSRKIPSNKIILKSQSFDQTNADILNVKTFGLISRSNESNDSIQKTKENDNVIDYFDFKGD